MFCSEILLFLSCLGVSVSKSRVSSAAVASVTSSMTSPDSLIPAIVTCKDDAGISTDAEENQQSEGESQKKTSSGGSPMVQRKSRRTDKEASKSSIPQPSNILAQRHGYPTSSNSSIRSTEPSNQNESGRLVMFTPPKMHVLQPHSHRRHFSHHLRDHFSSQILRSFENRKDTRSEIVPTLDACDYKDTNFLTEGSPPRTPTHRQCTRVKAVSDMSDEDPRGVRSSSTPKKKPVRLLPASLWKESSDRIKQWRSSSDSESSGETGRNANYLQKYKNESVSGPARPIKDTKYTHTPNLSYDGKSERVLRPSRSYNKPWLRQSSTKERIRHKNHQNPSSREMETKRELRCHKFAFGSSVPALTSLRSGSGSKSRLYICRTCLKRQRQTRTAGTQTETPDDSLESSYGSKEDLGDDVVDTTLSNTGMALYVMPHGVDSSESTSYSTEDTSSVAFDDDDLLNCSSQTALNFHDSKSDILFRIDEVATKLQQIKEDINSEMQEDRQSSSYQLMRNIFAELCEVASEVSELYDRFDSEEKDEQSEFNEVKKQVRRYKRACHLLENELARANSKPKDSVPASELEEEFSMSQQISTALYWELQNVDTKLRKMTAQNDLFRENLTSSEIHRALLGREVLQLQNTIDQMSLHASSVPTNENAPTKPHDTVPELHRQLQYQEEEKKAVLKKLIETDKEKERVEEKLRLYFDHYGDISSPDAMVGKEQEWRENDLKARINSVEEQCGMLGRRIMELETDNEKLAKLNAVTTAPPDSPPQMSLSDIQFLEDEVETLRLTLDEAEQENNALRYELKQLNEKPSLSDRKFQLYQTSLKGLATPTTSDKIAAWDAAGPGTPLTNRTETDFTLSGADNIPLFTFIDASTQTYIESPSTFSIKSLCSERSLPVMERSPSVTLTKELLELLNRSRDTNVENLVSQLTNLAVATRHLVDESPTSLHGTGDLHSSMVVGNENKTVVSCASHSISNKEEEKPPSRINRQHFHSQLEVKALKDHSQ